MVGTPAGSGTYGVPPFYLPNRFPSSFKTRRSTSACSSAAGASVLALVPTYQAGVSCGCAGEALAGAGRGEIASGPTIQFASVLVHVVNEGVLRPSPVDDFDRFCTPALFVQDGAGPFSGFVLADRPPGVDPQSTFVLTRLTGEDDVKTIVARSYSFGVGSCFIWKYCSST